MRKIQHQKTLSNIQMALRTLSDNNTSQQGTDLNKAYSIVYKDLVKKLVQLNINNPDFDIADGESDDNDYRKG